MGTTTVTREVWTVQWLTPQQPGFNMTGMIFGVKMTGSQHWDCLSLVNRRIKLILVPSQFGT